MLNIISLREDHLEDAAGLVSKRYQRLRAQVPLLPQSYGEVGKLLPLLQRIWSTSGGGVAATRAGRLVGFLTAWHMPSFRGKRSIYSPEWANAADLEDSARIYQALYSQLSADWAADQYVAHYISLFPNDVDALKAWHWLGFGMISVDALRGMDPIQGCDGDVHIQRAALQDVERVMALQHGLWLYEKNAPIFYLAEEKDRSFYEEWLQNPDKVVWLAYKDAEPVAIIRLGPADDDVCTIIYDEKTTSIYAAFAEEKIRAAGIGTALLAHALKSAQALGYERCAVSFEPMNVIGTRFWLKYFQPVCYTVLRIIDERVTAA